MAIVDSGERRTFESGAVRDIDESKGRCDLLPLGVISKLLHDNIFDYIDKYLYSGETGYLEEALRLFPDSSDYRNVDHMILDVSKHYAEGALKYGERNWEKGIPVHSYIDSAVRHYIKYRLGHTDERHDRAFVWNVLAAIWTHTKYPELRDIPAFFPSATPISLGTASGI